MGQEPGAVLPRPALVPLGQGRRRAAGATTRPAAATPTWRRPRRSPRATCSGWSCRQLRNPAPPACLAAIRDPNRTYLGRRQLSRFLAAVRNSTRSLQGDHERAADPAVLRRSRTTAGRATRRSARRCCRALSGKVKNVVFLTTDVHATLVNDARFQTLEPGGRANSGILDITVGPAATANFELEIDDAVGQGQRAAGGRRVPRAAAAQRARHAVLGAEDLQLRAGAGPRATGSRSPRRTSRGRPLTQDPNGAQRGDRLRAVRPQLHTLETSQGRRSVRRP